MKKSIFLILTTVLIAIFSFKENNPGFVIGKRVAFIVPEQFRPDTAVFKIVDINANTVTFFYEITEYQSGANWRGQTVRTGNAVVPKAAVDAMKISYDGTVTDTAALSNLLRAFNMRIIK